jgi:8-oxo-dGTP diphosphatase
MNEATLFAAGTVLWRRVEEEKIQIALIHRPRYEDWSFPKGKIEIGELEITAAYRETLEETGFKSIFGPELCTVSYPVGESIKSVRYWSAEATGEASPVQDLGEVDEILWLSVEDAYKKLTREGDAEVLKNFELFGSETIPLILLRHGTALPRQEWLGDDGDRPLAQLGQIQAKRILLNYAPYSINEIHSSDALRCYETVAPMAQALSLNLIYWSELSEYSFKKDKKSGLDVISEIIESQSRAIVCGHNPVLPDIVQKLIGKKNFKELEHGLRPAEAWVLHHRDGEIVAIDWHPAP